MCVSLYVVLSICYTCRFSLGQKIVVFLEKSVSHSMFVGHWLMFLCISSPCR